MTDDSDFKDLKEVMGGLKEDVHINGYTAVRACSALEWLLIDDRWRQTGYEDFAAFLDAIKLSQYKFAIDQRQRLAQMLSDKHASQRAIGRSLGVDHSTINRDLRGANAPAASPKPKQTAAPASPSGANAPPDWLGMDGAAAATALERQTQLSVKRRAAEARFVQRRQENWAKVQGAPSLDELLRTGARFGTIVIDPPWLMPEDKSSTMYGRAAVPWYVLQTIDDIRALPIAALADDDCHLYCWITCRALLAGYDRGLLEGWGFAPKNILTWCKPSIGVGVHWFRGQTEHVLFAVKGSRRVESRNLGTWFEAPEDADIGAYFEAPRGSPDHSSKPVEFNEQVVEKASPGPYLELFGRGEPRPGWVSWGENGLVVGPDKMIVSEAGPPLSYDQNDAAM